MRILLLPLFVLVFLAEGVVRELDSAAADSLTRAKERTAAKIKSWAKNAQVPPKVRTAWARVTSYSASAGRFAGKLVPQAMVEGAKRGAAEGRVRHCEFGEVRTAKSEMRKLRVGTPEYRDAMRQFNETTNRVSAARAARRGRGALASAATPPVVEVNTTFEPSAQPATTEPLADGGRPTNAAPPRTWDGSPETPADTRFFNLRESGYGGWIDQDGYPMTDEQHEQWVAEQDRAHGAGIADKTYEQTRDEIVARWIGNTDNGGSRMDSTEQATVNGDAPKKGPEERRRPGPECDWVAQEWAEDQERDQAWRKRQRNGGSGAQASRTGVTVIEVRNIGDLRTTYSSTERDLASVTDQINAGLSRLEASRSTYEQATGHVSAEQFDAETCGDVANTQDLVAEAVRKAREALAAIDAAAGAASSGKQGLERYRTQEEALASGPQNPVHTSALRWE